MSAKLNVFAVSNVRHNRKDYKPGDKIPGLKKDDLNRLLRLQAIKTVEEVIEPPPPPPKGTGGEGDPPIVPPKDQDDNDKSKDDKVNDDDKEEE